MADGRAKMVDKMAHTEDSIVVRDMSVHTTLKITPTFLPARRYASAGNSDRNVSVRLSRAGIVSKRRKLAA